MRQDESAWRSVQVQMNYNAAHPMEDVTSLRTAVLEIEGRDLKDLLAGDIARCCARPPLLIRQYIKTMTRHPTDAHSLRSAYLAAYCRCLERDQEERSRPGQRRVNRHGVCSWRRAPRLLCAKWSKRPVTSAVSKTPGRSCEVFMDREDKNVYLPCEGHAEAPEERRE